MPEDRVKTFFYLAAAILLGVVAATVLEHEFTKRIHANLEVIE